MKCETINDILRQSFFDGWVCNKIDRSLETYLLGTTFLYPNSDCIDLIVEVRNNDFIITDNGDLYLFLLSHGFELNEVRTFNLNAIAERFGVNYIDHEFITEAESYNFSLKVNLLAQAIQEAASMVHLIREYSRTDFKKLVINTFKSYKANVYPDPQEYAGMSFAQNGSSWNAAQWFGETWSVGESLLDPTFNIDYLPDPVVPVDAVGGCYVDYYNRVLGFDEASIAGAVTEGVTPPFITLLDPNQGLIDSTVSVTINGEGFEGGNAQVNLSGIGITQSSFVLVSDTEITVDFVIASNAPLGIRFVTVETDVDESNAVAFEVLATPVTPSQEVGGMLQDLLGGGQI